MNRGMPSWWTAWHAPNAPAHAASATPEWSNAEPATTLRARAMNCSMSGFTSRFGFDLQLTEQYCFRSRPFSAFNLSLSVQSINQLNGTSTQVNHDRVYLFVLMPHDLYPSITAITPKFHICVVPEPYRQGRSHADISFQPIGRKLLDLINRGTVQECGAPRVNSLTSNRWAWDDKSHWTFGGSYFARRMSDATVRVAQRHPQCGGAPRQPICLSFTQTPCPARRAGAGSAPGHKWRWSFECWRVPSGPG